MDYGGVIDIFCTLKVLHEKGIDIILHCFDSGRGEQPELNRYCREVNYYKRQEGHKGFCFNLPYIIASRSHPELLNRLAADDYPILLEGLHSTFLLQDKRFAGRKMVLRLFNVESQYYGRLFRHERSIFKKIYYFIESRLLRSYETVTANRLTILTLSEKDRDYYSSRLGAKAVYNLPVFLPYSEVMSEEGAGSFCLYHGNLEVSENEKAATWLLENVFSKLKIPFVICGKNPSKKLERLAHLSSHTCLVANPGDKELNDLISKAQINILPSFNETGVKLKLLNALFNGRHCLVNQAAVDGTPLGPLCHITETPEAMQRVIQQLYHMPFAEEEIRLRKKILGEYSNNATNADKLIGYLW